MSGSVENSWPKISVITTSLNHGDFIEEAIQSVLQQNYPNFEHIIIDGFSTDKTADVIARYPHLIFIQEKSTAVEAYNIGWEKATGDIICYFNSDDSYVPNSFSVVAQKFIEDASLKMVCGQYQVSEGDNIIKKSYFPSNRLSFESICFYPPGINTIFFEKNFMKKIGKFNNSYTRASDREYLLRCILSNHKWIQVPEIVMAYRLHKSSYTINKYVLYNRHIVMEHLRIIKYFLSLKTLSSSQQKILKAWRGFEKVRELLIYIKEKKIKFFVLNITIFLFTGMIFTFMFLTLPIYAKKKTLEYLTKK